MLLAHLSDLHVRDRGDVLALERQLDCIAAHHPIHIAITGDLLDRWDPGLLDRVLDVLSARGLMDPERLTILHGNHDLSSSGGHPRRTTDLWRLALRFWDPPPLLTRRARRFYQAIGRRADGVAREAPFIKSLPAGLRLVAIDSVPAPWGPLSVDSNGVTLRHGIGCVRREHCEFLARQRGETPLVTLLHHYPLEVAPFAWRSPRLPVTFRVPMAIPRRDRDRFWNAAHEAGVALVLCGHMHRARLEHHEGIAVGLNGQGGADWAGRPVSFYDIRADGVSLTIERT